MVALQLAGRIDRRLVRELALGKKRKRQRQLDAAVWSIHRRYGSQSLFRGRPPAAAMAAGGVPCVATGFPALDQALGCGGLPTGSLAELLGPATSGKTTIALKFLVQAQKKGGQVAYIDLAGTLDPDYAHRCGLDLSRLWIGQPADLVEGLAMAEALVRGGGLAALVFDAPDFFWDDPAAAARLAALLGRLVAPLARSDMVLLFLLESEVGRPAPLSALAHHASVRLRIGRERWLNRQGDIRGYTARVEVLKNRAGPAGRVVVLSIEFNGTVRGANGL